MNISNLANILEIKFWNSVIPIIQEEGPLMKTIRTFNKSPYVKVRSIGFLIFIWAAIGFVSGIILGKLIVILQLL